MLAKVLLANVTCHPLQSRSCTLGLANAIWPSTGSRTPYKARDVHLVYLAAGSSGWDDLREDPRFCALVERCDFMRTANTGGHTER